MFSTPDRKVPANRIRLTARLNELLQEDNKFDRDDEGSALKTNALELLVFEERAEAVALWIQGNSERIEDQDAKKRADCDSINAGLIMGELFKLRGRVGELESAMKAQIPAMEHAAEAGEALKAENELLKGEIRDLERRLKHSGAVPHQIAKKLKADLAKADAADKHAEAVREQHESHH
jgi:hypothetical protein